MTFNTISVTSNSVSNGGIILLSGTNSDIVMNTVTYSSPTSSSGYGGGFYFTNNGYTNLLINGGTISSPSAYNSGGFFYQINTDTFFYDLRSLTITNS